MSPKRVLILGGTGMLGSMLWSHLSPKAGLRVRRSQRRDKAGEGYFDATGTEADLDRLLADQGSGTDFVINALGMTKPEIKEGDFASEEAAKAVNTELPRRLARAAGRAKARVIHISTDGVFSGKAGPYDESAVPDPVDLYGRTKLGGEVADPRVLTVRCSIVGPDPEKGRGLFEWFRGLGNEGQAKGFTDQMWNGVTTLQFAELCLAIIERGAFDGLTATAPIRHFCPNPPVSKHDLLKAFAGALGTKTKIEAAVSSVPVNRVLTTRWPDLNALAGGPCDVATAVAGMLRAEPHLKASR
jgi:dTDP-4-dehydrorhamnose reductase